MAETLARLILAAAAKLLYRIRVQGLGRVPRRGPVLLVSNHGSFIDPILIGLAVRRPVRFLMSRTYYDLPVAHWFFRALRCIPISDRDSPRALLESFGRARQAIQSGDAVCIFAEGEISRHGQMLRFKKGFERIIDGLDVPVVPVHLDQVWGSIFSFERGRVLFKRPRRIPYPLTVTFGAPLPGSSGAFEVRQAILELGAEAFRHRLDGRPPLPLAFYREARRHPLRLCAVDSTGKRLSCAGAIAGSVLIGRALDRRLGPAKNVGILLPPSVGAVLANVGLSLMGRVPVNLNYTMSEDLVGACARKAGITHVVSSAKFLDKLGWRPEQRVLLVEKAGWSLKDAAAAALSLAYGIPSRWLERWLFPRARGPLEGLATIMFTSGSTGLPKGVMLTHANILSNIEAVTQVYQLQATDRVLGVLPFFHAFGCTGTLWLPLTTGLGAVYHYNPLDAKRIGDLAAEWRATFLVGTPTFLLAYLKRVAPERFRTLRTVVVGAEKLRPELAKAFEETFSLAPLEGYGATELSPAAALNIPDINWPGVRQKGSKPGSIGQPLPGVVMKVVDPESFEELPAGTPGLLLVKGPNVMKGYLDDPALTRKVLRDGFYVTGDIAAIDEDGFVTITDRLSRFSKIAGEMVPHVRVEEVLQELSGQVEQTFVVTAVPDDKRGERLVVLHTGYEGLDSLLSRLKESSLPKLWLPDRRAFHRVEAFPLLGSGKIDLAGLKKVARGLEGL